MTKGFSVREKSTYILGAESGFVLFRLFSFIEGTKQEQILISILNT